MVRPGETPSNCLWVGNLASDVTDVDLTSLFEKYGMIDSVTIYPSRGFGFLNFRNIDDSKEAKDALQGTFFHGIPLRIRFAKPEQGSKFREIRNRQYPNRNIDHFNPRRMPQYLVRSYSDSMYAGFTTQHEQGAEFRETWGGQYRDRSIGLPVPRIMPEDLSRDCFDPVYAGFTRQHPFQLPVVQRVDERPSNVLCIRYPPSVDIDEVKLYNAMILFGEIDSIKTYYDRNFSLVLFRSVEEAQCTKEGLQGKLFNDPRIIIEYSRSGLAYGRDLLEHHTSIIGPTTDFFPDENPYQSAQMYTSDHNPDDYKWRGIISKCGTFVFNARCIDILFGQRMEIPNVINCAYKKGLAMLTNCHENTVGFSIVTLWPDSEKDKDLYAQLLRHLNLNDRAWVATFDDGTSFFLVPPDFLMKVLKVDPTCIYGVVLKYAQPNLYVNAPSVETSFQAANDATPSVERISEIKDNQIARATELLTPELVATLKNIMQASSQAGMSR